jgi:hypothetical protein
MNQTDWMDFMNLVFSSGVNMINTAMATIGTELEADAKAKILFHLPYPDRRLENWGNLDGHTINFKTSNSDR